MEKRKPVDEKGPSEQKPDRVRTTGNKSVFGTSGFVENKSKNGGSRLQRSAAPASPWPSSLTIGVLGGYLLDKHLGTGFFFWIGLVVGILAAYRSLWVIYVRYIREKK